MQRSRPLLEDEDSDDEEEEEAEGRRRHLRLSQEYEQMGGQAGRWSCASCSFINGVLLRTCQVCGHPKDHRMYQEEDRNTRSCAFSWEVFGSLADEVMLCVFSHLNLEGLCRVSSVCRRWRRLADDDSLWRSLLYRVMPQADAEDCDMAPEDGTAKIPRRSAIYYNTASGRRLKAASLNKLIDLITPVGDETGSHFSAGDINEQKAFLATYLSFTTPEKLLVKLVHLYLRVCEKAKLLKDNQSNSGTTATDTKGRGGVSGEAALADETKRRSASGSGSLLQTPGNNHWAPYTAGPTAKTRKASLIGNKEKKEDQTSSGNGNGNGDEEASNAEIAPSPRMARGVADFEEVGAGDRPGPTQQRYQQEASPAVTLTEKEKGKEKETDEKEKERAPTWLSAHLPEAEATEEKDRAHPDDQQASLTSLLSASGEDITTRLRSRSTGFTASRRTSQGREGEIYLAEWRLKDKTKAASRTWEAKADADSATINFSDLGPEQHQGHVGSSSDNSADRLRWNSAAHATTKEVPAALPQLYSTSLPTSGPLSTCSSWSSGSVPTRPASFSSAMTHDPDPIQTLPLPSPPPSSHVLPRRERPNEIFAKQVRICSLLKKWIEQHFADFSPRVIFLMKVFIRGTIIRERNPMNAPLANSIVLSLSKKLRQGSGHSTDPANASIFMELPPEPVVPSNVCSPLLSLFDVPPIEVARQLTLIEFSRFKAIKMSEFFGQLWSRSPGSLKDKAPNVMAMINAFNEFCTWVAASIVTQERIKDRVKTMEYFVQTAKNLYRLKNFNTLMALLAGLRSESVYRLTYTRAEISRKSEKTLENLNMLMRGDNAYKCYREALAQSAPPCIPYLGVHLSDLTFIEDGNPDLIEGLINFTKRRLVFRVISELSRYQQAEYNLHPVPQVMALLKREGSRFGRHGPSSSPPGPEDLYRLSERREPRGAERKDLL